MKPKTILAAVWAVGLSAVWVAIAAGPAHATTYTWDNGGGGGGMAWATAANWDVGGSNPATPPTATDTAAFTGMASGTVTVAGTTSAGAVQFTTAGYTLSGGTLRLGSTTPQIQQTVAVTGTNVISSGIGLQTATNGLTVDVAGGTLYLNGLLTGFSGGLTKTSSGTLVLSTGNTYTGGTTINGGTLQQGINQAVPNAAVGITGGTLDRGGFNLTTGTLTLAGGTIQGSGNLTISKTINSTGNSVLTGGGLYVGHTGSPGNFFLNVTSGTLTIDDLISADGTATGLPISKSGAGTLIVTNSGNLIRCNAGYDHKFNGGLVVNGANEALNGHTYEIDTPAIDMTGTAAWDLNGFYQLTHSLSGVAANTITLNGGTMELGGGGPGPGQWIRTYNGLLVDGRAQGTVVLNMEGSSAAPYPTGTPLWTGTQAFNFAAGSTISNLVLEHGSVGGTGGASITGSVTLQTGTLAMPWSGAATVTKSTTGVVVFNAANVLSSSGPLWVTDGVLNLRTFAQTVPTLTMGGGTLAGTSGILTITTSADVQAGMITAQLSGGTVQKSTGGTVTLGAAGVLSNSALVVSGGVLNSQGYNQQVPRLQLFSGTLAGGSTVTVNTAIDARSGVIAANLIGAAGLTKSTGGTVILTGTNTYGGDTAVSAGELRVNGSVGSAVTVNPGGAVGGSGTLALGGLMLSGGTLEPGNNGVGILTVTGPATLAGGSTYEWQLSSATSAGQQDLLATTGSLNLTAFSGNPMTIDITSLGMSDFNDAANYQWVIASAAEINGFDANGYVFTVSGFSSMPTGTFSLSQGGDPDLVLSYTAPEPATLSLLALGGLALLRRRRGGR